MPSGFRQLIRRSRRSPLTWRYFFNLGPTLAYKLSHHSLPDELGRIVKDLNRNGIAITSVRALLGRQYALFEELHDAAERLRGRLADEIDAARKMADELRNIGAKTFIVPLLGHSPLLDPESVYARFTLQKPILDVANAYFGMYTRLRYYNVWYTLKTKSSPRESQLWHFDREDHYILKMFVYLSDVDEQAGPFTYAPGTHPKGPIRCEPPYFIEHGVRRSSDEQMAEVVPEDRWIKAVGPVGTVVFADTRGYHKGGLARERDRFMFVSMFTSPASESREWFKRPESLIPPEDRALAFALASGKRGPWLSLRVRPA